MDRLYLIYAACGLLAVVLALVSRAMHRLPLSEPLLAMEHGHGWLLSDAEAINWDRLIYGPDES